MNISKEEITFLIKNLKAENFLGKEVTISSFTYPDSIMPHWKQFNKSHFEKTIKNSNARKARIYVHIPFCNKRCTFCPFVTTVIKQEEEHSKYVQYIKKEIEQTMNLVGHTEVEELYFGGGTASILSAKLLKDILFYLKDKFSISKEYTWTLEGSPETITEEKLQIMKEAGVSRFSLGVQSLDDEVLRKVNRPHDANQAVIAINLIKNTNFHMFNVDVIPCLPEQTLESFADTIEKLAKLQVPTLAINPLTVISTTGLRNYKIDLTLHAQMMTKAKEILLKESYVQIRPTYFAQKKCVDGWKQDLALVQHKPQGVLERRKLGFGIAASSQIGNYCYIKTNNIKEYYTNIEQNNLPIEKEFTFEKQDIISKFFMIDFIQKKKFDTRLFEQVFNMPIPENEQEKLNKLIELGLATQDGSTISLTPKGMIFSELINIYFFPSKYQN